jgi:hypothetical protein
MDTETHDLDIAGPDGVIARWERDLASLTEHRNATARAAEGAVGSQAGHKLGQMARKLSVAITDAEKVLLTLKDAVGLVANVPPSPGQPVHGAFQVTVKEGVPYASALDLTVWPEKPITTLLNEALLLTGLSGQAGTWGLRIVGRGDVHALTVHEARIESGDVLELVRAGVGDQT